MKEYKIPTWSCPDCGYHQDFEPTAENMAIHFPNIPEGECPACFMGKTKTKEKKRVKMKKETKAEKKTRVTVLEDADIDAMTEEELGGRTKEELKAEATKKRNFFNKIKE